MENNNEFEKYTFIHPDPTLRNNLMIWGAECGSGWYPLIQELFDKIQVLVNNNSEYKELEVVQVKEKYGELRIYLNYSYDDIEKLIDEYTEKSLHICERCGKDGCLRDDHHWYTTLCDECWQIKR